MKMQMVVKDSQREITRIVGKVDCTNSDLEEVIRCEQALEKLLGYRIHILPETAPLIEEIQGEFGYGDDFDYGDDQS